ncbi:MAG TPA: hypothetical protein VFC65_19865 [Prolixibacteraceae bacterium]|nr:hypothetical protein [Prolixibacteraceae bacterium]
MSKRFIQYFILLILIVIPVLTGITSFVSDSSVIDSTKLQVRLPDSKFADFYRSQKEFNYTLPPFKSNLFQQLIQYLKNKFGSWKRFSEIIPLIFKLLMWSSVIFFLFIVITKTKIYKLFYTDKEFETPEFEFSTDNESFIDFDEAIRSQVELKQYRLAVRLLYLKLINILRSKEYIHYSKEKTNIDYWHDLSNDDLKSQFYVITSIYNHVWYGDLEIAEDQFLRFKSSFQSIYTAIDVQE